MTLFERKSWLENPDNQGTVERDRVCLLEIWCEVFDGSKLSFSNQDQREMKAIMTRIGWVRSKSNLRLGAIYGMQRCYLRPGSTLTRI